MHPSLNSLIFNAFTSTMQHDKRGSRELIQQAEPYFSGIVHDIFTFERIVAGVSFSCTLHQQLIWQPIFVPDKHIRFFTRIIFTSIADSFDKVCFYDATGSLTVVDVPYFKSTDQEEILTYYNTITSYHPLSSDHNNFSRMIRIHLMAEGLMNRKEIEISGELNTLAVSHTVLYKTLGSKYLKRINTQLWEGVNLNITNNSVTYIYKT